MDDILKIAKNYSKEKHIELLPASENNILDSLLFLFDENWEEEGAEYPYEIITYLLDCYYVLPERPDLASLFCWQAINHSYSFTELVHTEDCGQVSINISRPGITKGQHWHNFKWELFIVVAGHGLIQERNINTGETVEFEISGDKIEAVHMIPGWTHNIINLSETENLVTVMTCNEIFDPGHPDTFGEPV